MYNAYSTCYLQSIYYESYVLIWGLEKYNINDSATCLGILPFGYYKFAFGYHEQCLDFYFAVFLYHYSWFVLLPSFFTNEELWYNSIFL